MTTENFINARIINLYFVQGWLISKIAKAVGRDEAYVQEVIDAYERENG